MKKPIKRTRAKKPGKKSRHPRPRLPLGKSLGRPDVARRAKELLAGFGR